MKSDVEKGDLVVEIGSQVKYVVVGFIGRIIYLRSIDGETNFVTTAIDDTFDRDFVLVERRMGDV